MSITTSFRKLIRISALLLLVSMTALAAFAVAPGSEQAIRDEEPLKVQEELPPPVQKLNQQILENKVRDNLFKKEEKEQKEQAKKQES